MDSSLDTRKNTFLRRFSKRKLAMVGFIFFAVEIIMFFVLPMLGVLDPNTIGAAGFNAAPGGGALLGTDNLGRDCFARLIYGGRTSLIVGICAMVIGLVTGCVLGLVAGYFRGAAEQIIMRIADIFMSFPSMILALCMVAVVGPSLGTVIGVIGILEWPGVAKLVYGNVITVRNQEYIEAARVMGMKSFRIIFKEVLPNCVTPLLMVAPFRLSHAILTESSLSFLGAGIQAPEASWGNIIYSAQNLTTFTTRPWIWVPPGICLIITVIAINLIGEGVRTALDPRQTK